MKPLLELDLVLLARIGDTPIRYGWFEIALPMQYRMKNDFNVLVGPADETGAYRLVGATLQTRIDEDIALFPMDYVALERGWTRETTIRAVDLEAIGRLRRAHSIWGSSGSYPSDFLDRMKELEAFLSDRPHSDQTVVTFEGHVPAGITVSTR